MNTNKSFEYSVMRLLFGSLLVFFGIAILLSGIITVVLIHSLPYTLPHLLIFTLTIIFTLGTYFPGRERRNPYEYLGYTLSMLFVLSWCLLVFFAKTDICTGTGMGGNQVLRICQPNSELYILMGLIFIYGISLTLFNSISKSTKNRRIGMGVVFLGLLVISTAIWNAPFLYTAV